MRKIALKMPSRALLLTVVIILLVMTGCKKNSPSSSQQFTNFKITGVKINGFPALNNSSSWDVLAVGNYVHPDVFFILSNGPDQITGATFDNVQQSQTPLLNWNLTEPFQITNTSTVYDLYIGDSDVSTTIDGSDQIAQFNFSMDQYKSGYPPSFNLSDGKTSVTITGTWY